MYGPSADSIYIFVNQTDVLRAMLKDVDVVIDEARYLSTDGSGTKDGNIKLPDFLAQYGLSKSDSSKLKFLSNNGLLREDGSTGPQSFTQWFEKAVVRPDQVIRQLNTVTASPNQP